MINTSHRMEPTVKSLEKEIQGLREEFVRANAKIERLFERNIRWIDPSIFDLSGQIIQLKYAIKKLEKRPYVRLVKPRRQK